MQFLLEIIQHTPPWVFGILVVLIFLGLQQLRDRRVSRVRLLILPLAMAVLSLTGLARGIGWNPVAFCSWGAGMATAAVINELLFRAPSGVRAEATGGPFLVKGSWTPMIIMLAIFITRYVFAVMLALHPERRADSAFIAASASSLGLLSGIFAARALHIWRTKPAAASATAVAQSGGLGPMKLKTLVFTLGTLVALIALALVGAIAFGGPGMPPPMPSINNPFKAVDFSDLPPLDYFAARDGARLSYRTYAPRMGQATGSVVLVHGSSATSSSMHVMAKAFAEAGYFAYALDIRGHGASGEKGRISYVGQLEDDVEDFVRLVPPAKPSTLAGFSSGGGFVIRFAGSARQLLFQNYLLLSPFLSLDSPTSRPDSGGWVSVGLPRLVAISIINGFGIRSFDNLPVIRFALDEESKSFLTSEYSFALSANFGPQRDFIQNIKAIHQPCELVVGSNDEAFYADRFEDVFRSAGKIVPVTIVPDVGHIQLTLDAKAIAAEIKAVTSFDPSR